MKAMLMLLADVARGVLIGVLLGYAIYSVVLQDTGAQIVRYAGY